MKTACPAGVSMGRRRGQSDRHGRDACTAEGGRPRCGHRRIPAQFRATGCRNAPQPARISASVPATAVLPILRVACVAQSLKKGVCCKAVVLATVPGYTIAVAADAIGGACPVPRSSMSV
ncbi:hypothetical protein G6F35_013264 [Rhizopus arrhizus]|nr:hypothetical protein G6F35_013264 [Rhizopus arrhizus]KAG1256012.1 hypothetical protein G6F68_009983 [Rhizopus microsporus]